MFFSHVALIKKLYHFLGLPSYTVGYILQRIPTNLYLTSYCLNKSLLYWRLKALKKIDYMYEQGRQCAVSFPPQSQQPQSHRHTDTYLYYKHFP